MRSGLTFTISERLPTRGWSGRGPGWPTCSAAVHSARSGAHGRGVRAPHLVVGDCETASALLDKAAASQSWSSTWSRSALIPQTAAPVAASTAWVGPTGAVLATRNTVLGRWTRDGTCWSCSAPTLYRIGTLHWDCGSILPNAPLVHPPQGSAWLGSASRSAIAVQTWSSAWQARQHHPSSDLGSTKPGPPRAAGGVLGDQEAVKKGPGVRGVGPLVAAGRVAGQRVHIGGIAEHVPVQKHRSTRVAEA